MTPTSPASGTGSSPAPRWWCAAAAPMMTNTGIYRVLAAQSGWTEEDGRFYYYDEDGYKETNTWKKRNGDWFYLDEEGEIATNQRVDDYFVNDEGHMAKNQWVSAENEIGYDSPDSPDGFSDSGKLESGLQSSFSSLPLPDAVH